MPNPKITNRRIPVTEREAIRRSGVGKVSWIKIQTELVLFRPIDPSLKMLRPDLIALDKSTAIFEIRRVQIQTVAPRYEAESHLDIAAQFRDGTRFTRIVSCSLYSTARERGPGGFEASDVISLPAMHGDRN